MASLAALLVLLPAGVAGQQDTTRARADTLAADTLPADTILTPRERALQRLRNMAITPVQPDTTPADTLAADTLGADTLGADPIAGDTLAPDVVVGDSLAEPGAAERLDPQERRPGGILVVGDTTRDDTLSGDSVMALLRSLEGYSLTEYRGEAAIFEAETEQLELTGESQVSQAGSQLDTDSLLVYDGRSGIVCGYGRPVLSGQQDPIESREICFDIERNLGQAVGAETRFEQGGTWYVRGADNRVYLLTGGESNTLYGTRAEFTSCDLDHPHYVFQARSLKMVEDDIMVARDITLQFDDVPVFWLPWMVQSMKRDRRSGLLMPEFGINDIVRNSTGYSRNISNLGFYWAINDYASARGTFEWYSGNWTAVQGALTYRWLRQFLQGTLTAKQYWRERELGGSREMTLNTSNSWQPDERTSVRLNANYATSSEFVRDNSFDPQELNRKISSSASVNRSFTWGSMALGADRSEQLSTGQVDMKLPGLSLNLSPVTLFRFGDGGSASWTGSASTTRRTRTTVDSLGQPSTETVDASYNHGINIGRFGLGQRVTWHDEVEAGPTTAISVPQVPGGFATPGPGQVIGGVGGRGFSMAEESASTFGWSNSLSFQQPLWTGTTISPSVSLTGNQVRDERTGHIFLAEPNRLSAGATLNTAIYGFWPGVGPYGRIRHKISPTVRWSYSPAPEFTARQEEVFNIRNLRERNEISLSFNQTFEAKRRDDTAADSVAGGQGGAGAAGGAVGAGDVGDPGDVGAPGATGAPGEPRRLPGTETIMLLALDTRTSFRYDFVAAAEDGRGFLTDRVQNSIRSDVLRGLQISTTHSLFETQPAPEEGGLEPRRLSPFLTDLTASFSIDNNFWLFEALGLTSDATVDPAPGAGDDELEMSDERDRAVGAESDADEGDGPRSMIPSRGAEGPGIGGPRQGVGGWRASLNYSLERARPGLTSTRENQVLSGNVSFQPTEHWNVTWSTSYSVTDSDFAYHTLRLTRDLHRWQASFNFNKAQNGNFSMDFRVQLRDNPDLKLDYDQRTRHSDRPGRRDVPIR